MHSGPSRPDLPEMAPAELAERLKQGQPLVLIDVREEDEKDIADLPEYGQLRISMGEFVERISELNPDDAFVLYCRSGSRSGWATRQLLLRGFENVRNLRGGLLGWKAEVDPTIQEY